MAEAGPSGARSHKEEEMRRHCVMTLLQENKTPKEILEFVPSFSKSMVYRVYEDFKRDPTFSAVLEKGRKRDVAKSVRTQDLIDRVQEYVDENPEVSIRDLAARFDVSLGTMAKLVHKDLRHKSYKHRVRHALTDEHRATRLEKAKKLFDKIRHEDSGKLRFFSDEKIFSVEQTLNHQNDRYVRANLSGSTMTITNDFIAVLGFSFIV